MEKASSEQSQRARFHAIISGEVQWVGFRAFAEYHAQRLGVTGFVRNLPDGNVEVIAEGEKPALDALLEELHRGPGSARVKHVAISWQTPTGEYHSFYIRY
ncbi:MAG: acylphosphatase [Armatimonadetes bacterium]|nr:acylphosphatase [Armatimonadota bacterium]NIO75593.1 acylphosphatase [Armatimonadota bacterium]NIO98647.1 acylphosphatase [Armatimonadota bacterium]